MTRLRNNVAAKPAKAERVVQILKGGTSRVKRKEFPELEEFLWGDIVWADGYFAEGVGRINEDIVKIFKREQQGRA